MPKNQLFMENKAPRNFVNPFSEAFLQHWNLWKEFRWEEHQFKYKGVISEQMAVNRLVEVSEGEEEKAVRIINQSISRGWMDFYQLKQPKANGKSKQQSSKAGEEGSLRDRVRRAANKKFGGGETDGGESHLKAV